MKGTAARVFFRPESIANVQGICEGSGETIADQ